MATGVVPQSVPEQLCLAHNVVLHMLKGFDSKGHVVVMDNFFSNIGLFLDLVERDIYATGTIRFNCIGLPLELKTMKNWTQAAQGTVACGSALGILHMSNEIPQMVASSVLISFGHYKGQHVHIV